MALKPVTVSQLNEYISRVLMTDPKHPLLQEFNQYLYRHFPHFETWVLKKPLDIFARVVRDMSLPSIHKAFFSP